MAYPFLPGVVPLRSFLHEIPPSDPASSPMTNKCDPLGCPRRHSWPDRSLPGLPCPLAPAVVLPDAVASARTPLPADFWDDWGPLWLRDSSVFLQTDVIWWVLTETACGRWAAETMLTGTVQNKGRWLSRRGSGGRLQGGRVRGFENHVQ